MNPMVAAPPGFAQVSVRQMTDDGFMEPLVQLAERGTQNVFFVRAGDLFHKVIGFERDADGQYRFFLEDINGDPNLDRPDSLTLRDIIDNPERYALYANVGAMRPGNGAAGGGTRSSGHLMRSNMVV